MFFNRRTRKHDGMISIGQAHWPSGWGCKSCQDWVLLLFTASIDAVVYCLMPFISTERMDSNGLSSECCIFRISHGFCLICFWKYITVSCECIKGNEDCTR